MLYESIIVGSHLGLCLEGLTSEGVLEELEEVVICESRMAKNLTEVPKGRFPWLLRFSSVS